MAFVFTEELILRTVLIHVDAKYYFDLNKHGTYEKILEHDNNSGKVVFALMLVVKKCLWENLY